MIHGSSLAKSFILIIFLINIVSASEEIDYKIGFQYSLQFQSREYFQQTYGSLHYFGGNISIKDGDKSEIEIPHPNLYDDLSDNNWEFSGLTTPYDNLSDQAAIDFAHYLVDIMIKSQQFNNRLPTVGGDIHIAIITKTKGFKWISKEEYRYKDYGVPKHAEESL